MLAAGRRRPSTFTESRAALAGAFSAANPIDFDHTLRETFQLGSFRYVVTGAVETRSLGSSFALENASPGAVFLIVRYTETNLGHETQVVTEGAMQLKDEMGRTFRPSSRAMAAMTMEGQADLAITELHPGIARNAVTVFEIPITERPRRILVVEERGALGRGTTTVLLRAMLLGIVATCRAIGVPARAYIAWALDRLGTHRDVFALDLEQMTPAAFKRTLG